MPQTISVDAYLKYLHSAKLLGPGTPNYSAAVDQSTITMLHSIAEFVDLARTNLPTGYNGARAFLESVINGFPPPVSALPSEIRDLQQMYRDPSGVEPTRKDDKK